MKKKLDFFLFPLVATNILHGPLHYSLLFIQNFIGFGFLNYEIKHILKKYLEILRSCYKTNKLLQLDVRYFPKGVSPRATSQVRIPKWQLPQCAIYKAATSQRLG